MPVASGQYWNSVHGRELGEAAQDAEGLQGMRTLARNMAFLMRSIELGKEKYASRKRVPFERTNFIRYFAKKQEKTDMRLWMIPRIRFFLPVLFTGDVFRPDIDRLRPG